MTQLHDDWWNHARDATSPSGKRRPQSHFGFNVLEWRTQCWWRSTVVERRSLTGELSLSRARPAADG